MNLVDFILFLPLAYFIFKGFKKGIVVELLSFVALIIAIIGSMKMTTAIISASGIGTNSPYAVYVAYFLVFLAIFVLIILFSKLLDKLIKSAQLGFFNKLAGGIFGALKVIFVFSLLIWLSVQVDVLPDDIEQKSMSVRLFKNFAPMDY
jgi:membrane protein required for colicin V production